MTFWARLSIATASTTMTLRGPSGLGISIRRRLCRASSGVRLTLSPLPGPSLLQANISQPAARLQCDTARDEPQRDFRAWGSFTYTCSPCHIPSPYPDMLNYNRGKIDATFAFLALSRWTGSSYLPRTNPAHLPLNPGPGLVSFPTSQDSTGLHVRVPATK